MSTNSSTKLSSSSSEPLNRRKRCRVCRQPTLPRLISDDHTNKLKNHDHQMQRKRVSKIQRNLINVGPVTSSVNNLTLDCQSMLPHLGGKRVGNERENVYNSGDIAKEIDEAITRIESLIPSLQKLVTSAHTPSKMSDGNSGRTKDRVLNELGEAPNILTQGESVLCVRVNQVLGRLNDSEAIKQRQNGGYVCDDLLKPIAFLEKDANLEVDDIDSLRNPISQKTVMVEPLTLQVQRSESPALKGKATMNRVGSLKRAPSRTGSVASQTPEHIKGLRIIPYQVVPKERPNQSRNNLFEGRVKDAALVCQVAESPSVCSSKFMRHNRMSNLRESGCKLSSSRGRYTLEKRLPSHSTRKRVNGSFQTKVQQEHHSSYESSWESPSSYSSRVSSESGSCPSSRTYETSGSYTSEVKHGEVHSSGGYDTMSYYSSEDQYSDTSHPSSSQRSSSRKYKKDHHLGRPKGAGRFRRFKNKLGKIFHHHHHYNDNDEVGDVRSFWKRVGSMFHHNTKNENQEKKPKVHNPRKSLIKSDHRKTQGGGHFHALVDGLMKHLKHSKKPKHSKAGIGRLKSSIHGSKGGARQLPWLPNMKKRVGVRLPNKGGMKLTKTTKRPTLAVAKRILRK